MDEQCIALARIVENTGGGSGALRFEIVNGPHVGARFCVPSEAEPGLAGNVGAEISVRFHPEDQFAYLAPVLSPSAARPELPIPRNRYEERVEAKRERYAERAQAARAVASQRARAARVIMDGIPMGQPVLVGHHSERRHRKDLARIDTNLRKSVEAEDKAAYYERKAETYGTHGISSDDPEAIRKLRDELATLTECRKSEKLWNAALKKQAKAREKQLGRALTQGDYIAVVMESAIPEPFKSKLASCARAFPWLPQFGNHTQANIKRIEKRIAELERARQTEREPLTGTVDDTDYTIEWNAADNRVQVSFGKRPSDAVIERLKMTGFRWARSLGVWQRHASEGAWYHAKRSVCHKDAAPGHCDGCDNDDRPVKPYDVTFTNGTTGEPVKKEAK